MELAPLPIRLSPAYGGHSKDASTIFSAAAQGKEKTSINKKESINRRIILFLCTISVIKDRIK